MAKRVNTQFVAMLSASLLAVGAGVTGLVWYKWRHKIEDPKPLLAQAEQAEKAGDLVNAANLYTRAAVGTRDMHLAGADDLFFKASEFYLMLSDRATTLDEGTKYLQLHRAMLQNAQGINPRNAAVSQKLIDEIYEDATIRGQANGWLVLEQEATRFVKNQKEPPATAFAMRGEARLRWAMMVAAKDIPDSEYQEIDADLKKAIEMDPAASKPVAMYSRYLVFQATRARRARQVEEEKSVLEWAQKTLTDFLAKHPDEPEIITAYSATVHYAQRLARDFGVANPKATEEAVKIYAGVMNYDHQELVKLVTHALAAHPGEESLGELLADLYLEEKPPQADLAEKVLHDLLAAHPEEPLSYYRLAQFAQQKHDLTEAIKRYKECESHIRAWAGRKTLRHLILQHECFYRIAWASMDVAEAHGIDDAVGGAALAESLAYADKFRSAHGDKGIQELMDGRAYLLRRNVAEAIKLLKNAQDDLSNGRGAVETLRLTKMLLADANLQENQLGAALGYLNEAIDMRPELGAVLLIKKAAVLNQLGKKDDAKNLMDELLLSADQMPQAMVERAKMVRAIAMGAGGETALEDIGTAPALVEAATLRLGAGDAEGALVFLNHALEVNERYLPALRLAVIAQIQLGRKDEAAKIVAKALSHYKDSTEFLLMHATLSSTAAADDVAAPEKVIATIPDEFERQSLLAGLYAQRAEKARDLDEFFRNKDKELDALQKAEAKTPDINAAGARAKIENVVDRGFVAALTAAGKGRTPEEKTKYFSQGLAYVAKAEQFNLDGVSGVLYRGWLEFFKAPGPVGLGYLQRAVDQRPEFAPARILLAHAYMEIKPPNEDRALEEFRKAVPLQPNDINLLRSTIKLLMRKPTALNLQEAQELLKQGLAMSPNDKELAQYADLIGDQKNAVERREALLKTNPGDMENRRRLGILYYRKADEDQLSLPTKKGAEKQALEAAIKESREKTIELMKPLLQVEAPEIGDTLLVATLYALDGRMEDAIKLFDPYVKATAEEKVRYQGLQLVGEFCKSMGKYDQAEKYFLDAIQLQKVDDNAERRLGDLYFDMDNMPKSEVVYRSIDEKSKGSDPAVLRRFIETLIRQNKSAEADQLLATRVLNNKTDDPQGLVLRAFSRIQQQKPAEALEDLKIVLDKNHDYAEAIYYRALAQVMLRRDLDQAAGDLLALVAHQPTIAKYRVLLLRIYRFNRNYTGAAGQYADLLARQPDLKIVRKDYANFLMGLLLLQQRVMAEQSNPVTVSIRNVKPLETLEELLQDSMKVEPNEPMWLLMYGDLAMMVGDLKQARIAYEGVYKTFPEDANAVNSYLKLLLHTSAYAEASTVATRFLSTHAEQSDILLRRAAAFAGLKKDAEARNDVDQVFTITIRDGKKLQNYSGFLLALSQTSEIISPEGVVDRLRARIGADPNDYVSAIGQLHLLIFLNRSAEAVELVKNVKVPAEDKFFTAMFLRESAMAHYLNKDYDVALNEFNQLFKAAPNDVEGLNNYAYILGELKRAKEALPFIERAVKLVDGNPDQYLSNGSNGGIYDTFGWIKHLNGDEQGAIEQLERAIDALPSPSFYLHLAEAQKSAKKPDDARKSAEAGVKICAPADPTLPQLQQFLKDLGPG